MTSPSKHTRPQCHVLLGRLSKIRHSTHTKYTRFKNVSTGSGVTNMNKWENFGTDSFCTTNNTASNGSTQGTQTHYYPRYATVRYIIRYSLT